MPLFARQLQRVSTRIEAPSWFVRQTLLDFENIPKWSPTFRSITLHNPAAQPPYSAKEGPAVGTILVADLQGYKMKPEVAANNAEEFAWTGILGSSAIFGGRHSFVFKPITGNDNVTEFVNSEVFFGVLTGLCLPFISAQSSETPEAKETMFGKFNVALKMRTEELWRERQSQ